MESNERIDLNELLNNRREMGVQTEPKRKQSQLDIDYSYNNMSESSNKKINRTLVENNDTLFTVLADIDEKEKNDEIGSALGSVMENNDEGLVIKKTYICLLTGLELKDHSALNNSDTKKFFIDVSDYECNFEAGVGNFLMLLDPHDHEDHDSMLYSLYDSFEETFCVTTEQPGRPITDRKEPLAIHKSEDDENYTNLCKGFESFIETFFGEDGLRDTDKSLRQCRKHLNGKG